MVDILKDFSPQVCAMANTENILEYWRYFAKSPLLTVREEDGLYQVEAGFTKDQLSFGPQGVFHAVLKPEDVDRKIDEVVEYYTSRSMIFWWMIGAGTEPDNLGEYLKAHSFNEMDGTPVMAAELHNLIDDRPKPEGLVIEEAKDADSFRLFWELWYKGYPMPELLGTHFGQVCVDIGYHPDNPMKFYIGYLNGEPVTTSFILLGAGVVGLYGVTVLPAARGRGLGTEMSLYPLRIARDLGYYIGVLDATQQGIGIYRRIGFKEVNTPKMYTYASPDNVALEEKMKDFMHSKRE